MADAPQTAPYLTRETRLLIVTLTISAAVLLLLAQLRFPESAGLADATPPPLDRLAARASYDELASGVARVEAQVFPTLVVLRLVVPEEDAPRRLADVLTMPAHFANFNFNLITITDSLNKTIANIHNTIRYIQHF